MKDNVSLERLKQVLRYDPDTGHFTWRVEIKKGQVKAEDRAGAHLAPTQRKALISNDGIRYAAHRLAWFYQYGEWPNERIDHVDGDSSNNRISNLRQATHSQNMHNRKRCSRNTSGAKGVFWCEHRNKWRARIGNNGKTQSLGRYDTIEEAREAYRIAAEKLHGEFSCLDR